MMRTKIVAIAGCFTLALLAQTPIYKQTKYSTDERVRDLLSQMTLHEKAMQISQYLIGRDNNANNIGEAVSKVPPEVGSLLYFSRSPEMRNAMQKEAMTKSRLGIPLLFGYDVIHGFRTILPVPIGMGCSWNPDLVEEGSRIAAAEAKLTGIDWGFSPMVDIARDPRWGRVVEGFGEDPYLTGRMAASVVRGFQGKNLSDSLCIAACMKHFVGYGASEAGLDYVFTDVSPQTLWDTYLPPYLVGINAGAASVMSGFNDLNGVPATANRYSLTTVLRDKWNFRGLVVSDWGSIGQLVHQGYCSDKKESALTALSAGMDLDMMGHCFDKYVEELVNEGRLDIAAVDTAVSRVLRVKFDLGLFDRPYTPVVAEKQRYLLPQYKETARKLAAESMVLLKNKGNILPLEKNKKIAVIGPVADDAHNLMGSWFARGNDGDLISLLEAMRDTFGKRNVIYSQGCGYDSISPEQIKGALDAAKKASVIVLCIGEKGNWSGENASRSSLALPEAQLRLVDELSATGKPIVVVLSNGRPLELRDIEPKADAILDIWHPGTMGGAALCDILTGRENPSGKLDITFPLTTGQIPIYHNRRTSRTNSGKYHDISSEPMYKFGDGMSYTIYGYSDIEGPKRVRRGEISRFSVTVANEGDRDGKETVIWCIRNPYCSVVTRPVEELRHFEKKEIKAGEKATYYFDILPERDLAYVDGDGNAVLEDGVYWLMVNDKKIEFTLE